MNVSGPIALTRQIEGKLKAGKIVAYRIWWEKGEPYGKAHMETLTGDTLDAVLDAAEEDGYGYYVTDPDRPEREELAEWEILLEPGEDGIVSTPYTIVHVSDKLLRLIDGEQFVASSYLAAMIADFTLTLNDRIN